jgi:hypothetical protein
LVESTCLGFMLFKFATNRKDSAYSTNVDIMGRLALDSLRYYAPIVVISVACVTKTRTGRSVSSLHLQQYDRLRSA